MKLDTQGTKYKCNICGKEEKGRFEGTINVLHPPKGWFIGDKDMHLCSFECYKRHTGK